jgi:hypothetical protein
MNEQEVVQLLIKELSNIIISNEHDKTVITLPFRDYAGDPIKANIFVQGNEIVIDDLGRVAGMLFTLGQHTEDTAAFHLVKNLTDTYGITMDFDRGIIRQTVELPEDAGKFVDFIKVLTALHVSATELKQYKNKPEKSKLVSRLGRDIRQLKLNVTIEKQIQVLGKNEVWPVNFKYEKRGPGRVEVLIVTADLATKDPRQKAASVVASAVDLMGVDARDLRVVYEVDGIGSILAVQRARSLIDQYQQEFHYRTFNYADNFQRGALLALTKKDVVPAI